MGSMVGSVLVRPDESSRWIAELFEANLDAAFNVEYRITWSRAGCSGRRPGCFHQGDARQGPVARALQGAQLAPVDHLPRGAHDAAPTGTPRRTPSTSTASREWGGSGGSPSSRRARRRHRQGDQLQLAEPLRTAFVLRDVEELPIAEVAEILGIGQSACKMRVSRAREHLRVSLRGAI